MADPETLVALKRAYADTILNTTKEAAARVLVSEKKARVYQQELVTVRDEALNTLLRLKQMFDSKVKETEMVSLKQQQKVEELEAQLGEAEDIVGELRMELEELHDELRKLSNDQTHLKNDLEEDPCWKNRDAAVSVPEVSCSYQRSGAVGSCIPVEKGESVAANGLKIPSLTLIKSINRCSYKDNKDRCHHTLPAILTKRREAEGFTQMIHTVDRSTVHRDTSSSVEVGDENDGLGPHKVPSCKSVETLEMSGCADASDSISSVREGEDLMVSKKELGTPLSLKTSPKKERENDTKSAIVETEIMKKEKESCESMDVSASPLCEETPGFTVNKNRCIKYTFKRKRKKEVLSNLEGDSSVEKSRNMKQKTGEKDNGYLESRKPSLTNDSSRDSLCVAQLAIQLVPFSESKGLMQS